MRALHRAEIDALPQELLDIERQAADPVELSTVLAARQRAAVADVRRREGLDRLRRVLPTVLPHRYDALMFVDESRAPQPLHLRVREEEEPPETFPTGM